MRQEIQGDKKMGDNLGYYLLGSLALSIILNYILNIEDKIIGTIVGFIIIFSGAIAYLRYSKYKQTNTVSKNGYTKDIGIWPIVGTTKISHINLEVSMAERPYFFIFTTFSWEHFFKIYLKFSILLESSYDKKKVNFQTTLYKNDLPPKEYEIIYDQYNIFEKFLLLPIINKSQETVEKHMKDKYNIHVGKIVTIYQNPNDPDDLVMKNPFEESNS